ncbi:MAG TPA: DUF2269 family protein [Solirubrobacteraceae bacterium]|nr:DUF2269 family protein [Solirubrobacteraceae bacterium]
MTAVTLYDLGIAVHMMSVVIAFGVTFAYPIIFAVGARHEPRSLPLLHRVEYTIERWLVNPGLLVVVLAGAYLASKGHHWSEFFVQWGLGAAIVIGALVGSVMIPTAKRAEQLAERDVAAAAGGSTVVFGEDYLGLARRLSIVGSLLSTLVLVTILFMVIRP